jgi:hypothetical protein
MHDTLAISKYLSEVHADWRANQSAFPLNVYPPKHWPIPFFGNPASAVVATVGVNPSSEEFRDGRNWGATKSMVAWKNRLKNYFNRCVPTSLADARPPSHEWFEGWRLGLAVLGRSYEAGTAAHFDVSYRPTTAMKWNRKTDPKEFRRMVELDVKWFFRLLPLCPKLRLLVTFGPIVCDDNSTERLARFLIHHAPKYDFKASKEGIFWVFNHPDCRAGIYVHEVPMTGEKCFTREVIKNFQRHRHELVKLLGEPNQLPPLQ